MTLEFERDDAMVQLSDAGVARRDQMLGELLSQIETVHRRRRVRRTIAITTIPLIVIGSALSVWLVGISSNAPTQGQSTQLVQQEGANGRSSPVTPQFTSVIVELVQTQSNISAQYRAAAQPQVVFLDDAALLDALAQLNRPAGLIRSEGRAWLTTDVVDHSSG